MKFSDGFDGENDVCNVFDGMSVNKILRNEGTVQELVVLDDKNMGLVSLDSSKDGDTGEEISKDMEINSKSWVAFDSYCMGSEIIT